MEISNMTKILSIAAILVATAGAQAAFEAVAVDWGTTDGSAALTASGDYIQGPFQNGGAGLPNDLGQGGQATQVGGWASSSVWISGIGTFPVGSMSPGEVGHSPSIGTPSNGEVIVGASLEGSYLVTPTNGDDFEFSGPGVAGGEAAVLIARLSVPAGGTLNQIGRAHV